MMYIIVYYIYDDRSEPRFRVARDSEQRDKQIRELKAQNDVGLILVGELSLNFERDYDKR